MHSLTFASAKKKFPFFRFILAKLPQASIRFLSYSNAFFISFSPSSILPICNFKLPRFVIDGAYV